MKHYKINMQIHHNYISNATQTKFLGLTIDDTLSWKHHIDQVIKRMSSACYALRFIKYQLPIDTLKIIYFTHIHTIMSYGVILWGNSPSAKKVFLLQKKIIRIITNTRPRESCKEIFKNMQMMLYSQYIYSLILFTVNNKHLFTPNNEIHKYNTRNNNNIHPALANLTKFNKGPYMSGIKMFNHLPQYLKTLDHNSVHFRSSLKRFMYHHSFYSMEEFYGYKETTV